MSSIERMNARHALYHLREAMPYLGHNVDTHVLIESALLKLETLIIEDLKSLWAE